MTLHPQTGGVLRDGRGCVRVCESACVHADVLAVRCAQAHRVPSPHAGVVSPPGGSDSNESAFNAIQSLGREDPLENGMSINSSILAWRIPGQRSLAVHGIAKS